MSELLWKKKKWRRKDKIKLNEQVFFYSLNSELDLNYLNEIHLQYNRYKLYLMADKKMYQLEAIFKI